MEFRYERPESMGRAIELLKRLDGEKITFMAGGTDVVPTLKHTEGNPGVLISLARIEELASVDIEPDKRILLGSQATLASIAAHGGLQKTLPCLSDTAAVVASPQIRNRATLGGNLLVNTRCIYFNQSGQNRESHGACFKAGGDLCQLIPNAARGKSPLCRARFVSDLAPVMLVLGARLHFAGAWGARAIEIRDFYLPDGIERNCLSEGEILTHVEIPLPGPSEGVAYEKLRIRNAIDFPSVGVAVGIDKSAQGRQLSLALTGVNESPFFVSLLEAKHASWDDCVMSAISQATKAAVPLKQDFFPPSYRKKMIDVLTRRAIKKLERT